MQAAQDEPPLVPPIFPSAPAQGWSTATWEWSRAQLSAIPAVTALEFIERLPGVTRFRAGNFGRPEGVTALAMGGSRIRVFLDGFELDPFQGGSYELETLPLLELESIRVERSLMEMRVDLRTYQLNQAEAHSVVELGTGVYKTRLLRALFSRGIGRKSTFTGSFDLVNTRGIGIDEPYNHGGSNIRWTYVPLDRLSIVAEWRRSTIDRERQTFPTQISRSELLLRARSPLSEALLVEGYVSRSTLEQELDAAPAERSTTRVGARAAFSSSTFHAEATGALRGDVDHFPPLPSSEVEGRASLLPGRAVRLEASGRYASWDDGSASGGQLKAVLTPIPAFSVFGALEAGSRPLATFRESGEDTVPILVAAEGGGWRAGAELSRGSASLGVAAFNSGLSTVASFGLDFDRGLLPVDAEAVTGAELYGHLPLWRVFSIEGWYTRFQDAEARPYTPVEAARVILSARGSYYSDQLEPTLLVEASHRGSALVPNSDYSALDTRSAAYQALDLSLRIRIIDVEAYLVWNNITSSRSAIDMPWVPASIPRIIYGARWRFRG